MYVPLNLCIHPIGLSPKIIRLSINSYQYSLQNGLRIQTPGYPIHTFLFETSTHIMILSCNVTFCLPVSRVFKSIFSPSIKLYWSRKTVWVTFPTYVGRLKKGNKILLSLQHSKYIASLYELYPLHFNTFLPILSFCSETLLSFSLDVFVLSTVKICSLFWDQM